MDTSSIEIFPQIVLAIGITAAIFFLFMIVETLYRAYLNYGSARIAVYPYTGSSSKQKTFYQDPNNARSTLLPLSDNQLTGIEFSYTTFLYVSDDTDDGTAGWKSVFYKGYERGPFPVMGPGVFVSSANRQTSAPTLRIVMNTYEKWFNTVDVAQIPFNKWFHLAVVLRNNALEVYINGNLANKKKFNGTLPYQNYGPLVLFPNYRSSPLEFSNVNNPSELKRGIPPGEDMTINGKFSGFISNLYYFSYAMSYSEIQAMLNLGPSSEFDQGSMDKPPYLIDSWWTQRKGN
jgi:hypothetical protein